MMPDPGEFKMDFRPQSYGFEKFDRLVSVFDLIKDPATRRAVRQALVDDDVGVDIEELVQQYALNKRVKAGLERLVWFGKSLLLTLWQYGNTVPAIAVVWLGRWSRRSTRRWMR